LVQFSCVREDVLSIGVDHLPDLDHVGRERLPGLERKQISVTCHTEMILGFVGGFDCDVEATRELPTRGRAAPLDDVGCDAVGRTGELAAKRGGVVASEMARGLVQVERHCVRPLPGVGVFESLHEELIPHASVSPAAILSRATPANLRAPGPVHLTPRAESRRRGPGSSSAAAAGPSGFPGAASGSALAP
jgi:hypothetical protein